MSSTAPPDLTPPKDVDKVPRLVVALSATSVFQDWECERHRHRKAQLLYSVRGMLNCEIEDGVWIVPPQCAVWIPGDLPHSARGSGETACYCLFVEPDAAPDLPKTCCTISVSPLLRELLLKVVGFPELYTLGGREDRLIATLLDELAAAPVEDLHLPMPRDSRLCRLAEMLLADPTDKTSKGNLAIRIGMSERSMSRLLLHEIGMSFRTLASSTVCHPRAATPDQGRKRADGGAGTGLRKCQRIHHHVPQGGRQAAGAVSLRSNDRRGVRRCVRHQAARSGFIPKTL